MNTSVILDTDIGYDPDDCFALLMLLNSPELDLNLIITNDEAGGRRAVLTKKVLRLLDREEIKIVQGEDLGNDHFVADELIEGEMYTADTDYLAAAKQLLDTSDKVIYISIGVFTNLANILKAYPDEIHKLEVHQMGAAVDYIRRPGWTEHNVKLDPESAEYVLTSGVDLSLVLSQTTFNPVYQITDKNPIFDKLKQSDKPIHQLLARHTELFHAEKKPFWPFMHDPLTVSVALGKNFVTFTESGVIMDEQYGFHPSDKTPKIKLSQTETNDLAFMEFFTKRIFDL